MRPEDYDDVEQFIFVAEQLKLCHDLIVTERPARQRAALILLDHVADILMYRRCWWLFRRIDTEAFPRTFLPQFDQRQRRRAFSNFETRLTIAMQYDDLGHHDSLFTEREKAIVLIVHTYRNLAHHHDTHNARTVGLIARIALWAISGAWFRSYRVGNDLMASGTTDRLLEIGTPILTGDWLNPRMQAWLLRRSLGCELPPKAREVGTALASDLRRRITIVYSDAGSVPGGLRELDAMIEHYRFWAVGRSDDRLGELGRIVDPSRRLVEDHPTEWNNSDISARYFREAEETVPLYHARIRELKTSLGFRPASHILADAQATARKLSRGRMILEKMLSRYQQLDHELAKVEDAADEALARHEQWVDIETEEAKLRDVLD